MLQKLFSNGLRNLKFLHMKHKGILLFLFPRAQSGGVSVGYAGQNSLIRVTPHNFRDLVKLIV